MESLDSTVGREVLRDMGDLFKVVGWPLLSAVYSSSTDASPKTGADIYKLFISLSTHMIKCRRISPGMDAFGNKIVPQLSIMEGELRFRLACPPKTQTPFASYPFELKHFSKAEWERVLPKDVSLGEYIGSQGRRKGSEVLTPPTTLVDRIQRIGFVLAKEIIDFMPQLEHANETLPTPANPSVSEGIRGVTKFVWGLCGNVRTRDEMLRAKCVAMVGTLVPRPELFDPVLRRKFLQRVRHMEKGTHRNNRQSELRLQELEDSRSARKQAVVKKRVIARRRAEVPLVTQKAKLNKLAYPALLDQCAIRGLKRCQGKPKKELVQLCLRNKKRVRYLHPPSETSEGYDSDTISSVWSQVCEGRPHPTLIEDDDGTEEEDFHTPTPSLIQDDDETEE